MRLNSTLWAGFFSLLLGICLCGCSPEENLTEKKENKKSFLHIGEFTITRVNDQLTLAKDGAGRVLALVPRGAEAPAGYEEHMIIRTPVKRVVAYSSFDVATLRLLGEIDTLVGVTTPKERWYVDDVKNAMEEGRVVYLGGSSAIDFERLKQQQPELVLTWDPSIIPMLNDLGIACVITSTPVAMCLNARMNFVRFLGPFFKKEANAELFFQQVSAALANIRSKTKGQTIKPNVMWGDMYEKRVLVEPGNAWIGELVELVQSDYLFEDVYGTSCIEISMERFLYSGIQANI